MWVVAAAVSSTLVAVSVLVGLLIRYGLVPFLERQLIAPILTQLGQVVQIANDARKEVGIIAHAWEHHINWSQDEVDAIWRELRTGKRVARQRGKGHADELDT